MAVTMKPSVHLNGSSQEALMESYAEAYQAVGDAIKVVSMAAPNARDYYVQGPDAYKQAMFEHEERIVKLRTIQDELMTLYTSVEEGKAEN